MADPLVVSPSGVDAIALGDNAAFEHNGVLVQYEGIGTGEVGRSLAFVRDPRFVGTGFFAGEAPDGLTTVYGDPIPADVFVYWRDPDDPMAQEVLVGATKSAPDGTWLITGLNYNLRYVVRARASGRDDVTVVGVQPSRADVITYEGEFTNTEDFDGVAGEILITSGLPPFTATVIQPLPFGLFPVVSGRNLIIDGTTGADEVASFDVKVTSSNGAEKIIPLQIVVGFKAPQKLESEVIVDYDVFSVALTWEVASSTQQVKVYRSETPFDMGDLPVPLAVLTGSATTYTDNDVVEDEAFYYMVSAEREGYVRYSVVVREFVVTGDPHWDKVVALLQFEDGIIDATGRVWTVRGSQAIVRSESALVGEKGLRVDGLDSSVDTTTQLDISGATPVTIEGFMRIASYTGPKMPGANVYRQTIFGQSGSVGSRDQMLAIENGKVLLQRTAYYAGSSIEAVGVNLVPLNEKFHFEYSFDGARARVFINGVKEIDVASANGWANTGYPFRIGAAYNVGYPNYRAGANADFDEIRITAGVARHTDNFTPPSGPFPNQ